MDANKTWNYKFQFNNDEDSCVALQTLIKEGWSIKGYSVAEGYTWFFLEKGKRA